MNEIRKTLLFIAAAILVTVSLIVTAPNNPTPEAFSDRGDLFFQNFSDPNASVSLEIINFDEETGQIRAFNVVFKGTRWRIPSHHNYPADNKDQLARTAAGLIEVRKDDVVTETSSDHEALGVVDPLDKSVVSLAGRGKRVTIKDKNENLLADIIIGKKVPERESIYRYLRIPGQKRTYAARFNVDISSQFGDWIEDDLLKLDRNQIRGVTLRNYSVDERTRILNQQDTIVLNRNKNNWKAKRMQKGQVVNQEKLENLLKALDELNIVDIRPKPVGLSKSLKNNDAGIMVDDEGIISLQEKGFYFTQDNQLVSNEGETQVRTEDGLIYTLRFGEIVDNASIGENRYLFITTDFDEKVFTEPPSPSDMNFLNKPDTLWSANDKTNFELQGKYEHWEKIVDDGRKKESYLNSRFAQWYYIISGGSFDKIHLQRGDIITSP